MVHSPKEEQNSYYLDQLCTIGVCGGLGVVMILLWHYDVLGVILSPQFHLPVLLGGITLLVLVATHILGVWTSFRRTVPHRHDRRWTPWRQAVVLLPIAFYCLNIPAAPANGQDQDAQETGLGTLDLNEPQRFADWADYRWEWEGKIVRLKGLIETVRNDERTFKLYRMVKSPDREDRQIMEAILIVSPESIEVSSYRGKQVLVTGWIKFVQQKGDHYIPMLELRKSPETGLLDIHVLSPESK